MDSVDLNFSTVAQVSRFPTLRLVAKWYPGVDNADGAYTMMHLAGDSAVTVVGRIFASPGSLEVMGYCMSLETRRKDLDQGGPCSPGS
jgi:hypothetical protein